MKYTALLQPRQVGTMIYSDTALKRLAAQAVGMPVYKSGSKNATGVVIKAWVDEDGVKAEIEIEEELNNGTEV